MAIINLTATDGTPIQYDDKRPAGSGGVKDVFFSPDPSYVVAVVRKRPAKSGIERLETIVNTYYQNIIKGEYGEYWEELFNWPTKMVDDQGVLALVTPTWEKDFFFKTGSVKNDMLKIKGKEKNGKWFASANHQQKHLDPTERGEWNRYFACCLKIARAVHRMHAAGLAHSDLSCNNVLIDPVLGKACIIDIDGLVVPQRFQPDVIGTPDFIAPEVVATHDLKIGDTNKKLPRKETDLHALPVLIYMYLLFRHPLRGKKHHSDDPNEDENLMMGSQALFVEHPTDDTNRINTKHSRDSELPYADTEKIPYTVLGPYLKELFDKVFIEGLHDPRKRPSAASWVTALVKTVDLLQPCENKSCAHKWFVFDNTTKPICPFCNTHYPLPLPVLTFYDSRGSQGKYMPANHRLMAYNQQYIYQWHINRLIAPNEKLTEEQKKPVGYFLFHNCKWVLVNQNLPTLQDADTKEKVPINTHIELTNNRRILFEEGGRFALVQISNADTHSQEVWTEDTVKLRESSPVYFLLDCSESSSDEYREQIRTSLDTILDELRTDPSALETVQLGVITFGESAHLELPLTDLHDFFVPHLRPLGPGRSLGEALELVTATARQDRVTRRFVMPKLIIMMGGDPTDDWEKGLALVNTIRWYMRIGCQAKDTDQEVLRQIVDLIEFTDDEVLRDYCRGLAKFMGDP